MINSTTILQYIHYQIVIYLILLLFKLLAVVIFRFLTFTIGNMHLICTHSLVTVTVNRINYITNQITSLFHQFVGSIKIIHYNNHAIQCRLWKIVLDFKLSVLVLIYYQHQYSSKGNSYSIRVNQPIQQLKKFMKK